MTKFIITNMQPADGARNTLATFNVKLIDVGVKLLNITLSRPPHVPAPETRMYFPSLKRFSSSAYYIYPGDLRNRIGAAACATFTAMTGEPATFIPPKETDDGDEEPADAGMIRFLGAENETLAKAGI